MDLSAVAVLKGCECIAEGMGFADRDEYTVKFVGCDGDEPAARVAGVVLDEFRVEVADCESTVGASYAGVGSVAALGFEYSEGNFEGSKSSRSAGDVKGGGC